MLGSLVEGHMYVFEDRKALWCHLIGHPCVAFRVLLRDGISSFAPSMRVNV